GAVKDPQGRPVPGTAITLFARSGAPEITTTSDDLGTYRFTGLPEGRYLLRAKAPGFEAFLAEDVDLGVRAQETRDIALELAGLQEQVVVTASGTPQAPAEVSKAITSIEQADADARDAGSLAAVVALTAGVRMQKLGGPGSFTSVQLRGLRTEDTA